MVWPRLFSIASEDVDAGRVRRGGPFIRAARAKFSLADLDPLEDNAPTTPTAQGAGGSNIVILVKEGTRKIEFNQVVGQGDEGEIPQLEFAAMEEMHKMLVEVKRCASSSRA